MRPRGVRGVRALRIGDGDYGSALSATGAAGGSNGPAWECGVVGNREISGKISGNMRIAGTRALQRGLA